MIPSRAMACSRRGAPVRLCRPAPQVEKKEPITMTQGDGQASMPMTRFPCKASPNLQVSKERWSVELLESDLKAEKKNISVPYLSVNPQTKSPFQRPNPTRT